MAISENNIKMSDVGGLNGSSTNLKLRELAINVTSPWSINKPHDGEYSNTVGQYNGIKLISADTPEYLYTAITSGSTYEEVNKVSSTSHNVRLGDFKGFEYKTDYNPIGHLYNDGDVIDLAGLEESDYKYQTNVEGKDATSSTTLISRNDLFPNYSELSRGVLFYKEGSDNYDFWCTGTLPNLTSNSSFGDKDEWIEFIGGESEVTAVEFISDISNGTYGTSTEILLGTSKFYAFPDNKHTITLKRTVSDELLSIAITNGVYKLTTSSGLISYNMTTEVSFDIEIECTSPGATYEVSYSINYNTTPSVATPLTGAVITTDSTGKGKKKINLTNTLENINAHTGSVTITALAGELTVTEFIQQQDAVIVTESETD